MGLPPCFICHIYKGVNFYKFCLHPKNDGDRVLLVVTQWAFGAQMTLYERRCDVITSHRRSYDVILRSCAHWVNFSDTNHYKSGLAAGSGDCISVGGYQKRGDTLREFLPLVEQWGKIT